MKIIPKVLRELIIKKAILEANLTDIFENYTQGRNVEYWIKLIHSEKHVESLKSVSIGRKSFTTCSVDLFEGIDRIMNKKIKIFFVQRGLQDIMR